MKSPAIKKRSIVVVGHKTSISLEDEFWKSLREIAWQRDQAICQLIAEIDEGRHLANLSSAIRMFILRYYREQLDRPRTMPASPATDPLAAVEPGARCSDQASGGSS